MAVQQRRVSELLEPRLVRTSRAVRVEITGGLLRVLAQTVLPVGVAVIALTANPDLGISPFWTALILPIVVSALGTLAWGRPS
jgi:hypothetical protein